MLQVFSSSTDPTAKYLSNMQLLPRPLTYKGKEYPSVEHGFQAAKYRHVNEDKPKKVLKMFEVGGAYANLSTARVKGKADSKAMEAHGVTLNTTDWDKKKESIMAHLLKERTKVDPRFNAMLINLARRNFRILHHDPEQGTQSYWGGSFPASIKENDRTPSDFYGDNKFGIIMEELAKKLLKKSIKKEKKKLKPRSRSTSPSRPKTKKRGKSLTKSVLKKEESGKKRQRRVSFSDDHGSEHEAKEPESPRTLRIRKVVEKHLKGVGGPSSFDRVVSGIKTICAKNKTPSDCMRKCLILLIGANPEEKVGIVRLSSTVMDLGTYAAALHGILDAINESKKAELRKKAEEFARISFETSRLKGIPRPALGDNTKWSGKGNAISRQ